MRRNSGATLVRAWTIAAAIVLVPCVAPFSAQAQNPPVTFAGKQIRLLIGYSPTSYGYDTYGRLLA